MANSLCDPPPVISRERTCEIIGPHFDDLSGSVLAGWDAWLKIIAGDEERFVTLSTTARARIVHDYAVREAASRFDNRPGIRVRTEHNSLLLIFGEEAIVQFRHLDGGLLRSFSPTKRQRNMLQQELSLPDLANEATLLTLGYTVDPQDDITLNRIMITCQWYQMFCWLPIGLLEHGDDGLLPNPVFNTLPVSDGPAKTELIPTYPSPLPRKKTNTDNR